MTQLSALPVVEINKDAAACIRDVNRTGQPVAIADQGKPAAVILSAEAYATSIERLELLQDISTSERELADGLALSHEDAKAQVLAGLRS